MFLQSVFGLKESYLSFDVMLHFGTLLALILYFRKDIWKIIKGIVFGLAKREGFQFEQKLFQYLIIATIPTALIGFFFRDLFESLFLNPKIVGVMLLITGLILFLTKLVNEEFKDLKKMNWLVSIIIGISQAMAIIPGISRSGLTISTGIFLGLNREFSAKFSFLLSIPTILGAGLLEINKLQSGVNNLVIIGTAISFLTGILALGLIMKWVKTGKFYYFSYYCWFIGVIIIIFIKK